jgi:hypothetical protein
VRPSTPQSARPYVRWWWFNGPIRKPDIEVQLDWLKASSFGGVEIAFMYAQPGSEPGPKWLSPEWAELVAHAKHHCDRIGLGCDFTFGSAWPFGGSIVEERDAARTFEGPSRQRLEKSWEGADNAHLRILNHLDRNALAAYSERTGAALADALKGGPSAIFCDSFEVEPEQLWTQGLDMLFIQEFGYDLRPFQNSLNEHPDVRYDYRKLVSRLLVTEFYAPFTEAAHRLNAASRVQCLGAPCDLLEAYCAVDVPETEALLFDPHFAQFAASAAAVSGSPIVSAESFTCLYGWKPYPGPGPHQGEEQTADLRLLADSLFANGVNFIIWHGMPCNPPGGSNRFYAATHVGPDSSFAPELPAFNRYLEQVSSIMRQGRSYSDVAVYLPLEDNWMLDRLPDELKRPSAEWHWELQYQRFPAETIPFRPLWVSMGLLRDAKWERGKLRCGAAEFSALYLDVDWLDAEALERILELAEAGLPVCLKRRPRQPGHQPSADYDRVLARLQALPNVCADMEKTVNHPPLLEGASLPEFWCRVGDTEAFVFFAHPQTRQVSYPLRYGQSLSMGAVELPLAVNLFERRFELVLRFEPYRSVLVRLSRSGRTDIITPDHTAGAEGGPAMT